MELKLQPKTHKTVIKNITMLIIFLIQSSKSIQKLYMSYDELQIIDRFLI